MYLYLQFRQEVSAYEQEIAKKVCNVNGAMTDIGDRLGKETYCGW